MGKLQNAEDELKKAKYGDDVETPEGEDETASDEAQEESEEGEEVEDQTEEESEEEPSFVKEFPNIKGDTPEEYAKNLEIAYQNSTAEAMRLKQSVEDVEEPDLSDPISLYMKQKMDEEITVAFSDFKQKHPQVSDPTEYNKFTQTVGVLSSTILQSEKRMAPPKELYSKAAVILGWGLEETDDDLSTAIKDRAAASKTTSSTKPRPKQSKVTDAQVILYKKLNPLVEKTDSEIRQELEPYTN